MSDKRKLIHSSFNTKNKSFGLAVTFLQLKESNRIKIGDDEDAEVSSIDVWGFWGINYELIL